MQGLDPGRSIRGVAVCTTVVALEGECVAREADPRVVFFQPRHTQDNRVVGQLRHVELDLLLVVVRNPHADCGVVGDLPTFGRAAIEDL